MRRRSAVMEDILVDTQLKDQLADKHEPEIQVAKKGKLFLKTVKVVAGGGKQQKNEGPPCDSWSWRKYGQKPIKGSPYPRGYYRCSTSKGCPAKKQVERCKTDASMLKITYTSMHNHSGPNSHSSQKVSSLAMCEEPKVEQSEQARCSADKEEIAAEYFHYLEAPHDATGHIDQDTFSLDMESTHESLGVLFDEEPISLHTFRTSPKSESNEYDFFDELEDLPLSSLPFRSLMNSNFNGDRILVQPS